MTAVAPLDAEAAVAARPGAGDFPLTGLAHFPGAALHRLAALRDRFPEATGSHRLDYRVAPDELGWLSSIATDLLSQSAFPVRVLFLNKTPAENWALGWHQDRVIAVRERKEVPGFDRWTLKNGVPHCAPPVALLARMVTLRIHLDDVGPDNAPLLAAAGSHRLGIIPEDEVAAVAARSDVAQCLASAGDVWATATLLLHASARARIGRARRVIQVDYACDSLPGGLAWCTQ